MEFLRKEKLVGSAFNFFAYLRMNRLNVLRKIKLRMNALTRVMPISKVYFRLSDCIENEFLVEIVY